MKPDPENNIYTVLLFIKLRKAFAFIFAFSLFTFAFVLQLNPPNGFWYQQFMPNLQGAIIVDIKFTDSLTGYAITSRDSSNITSVLKTTNGGDNWNVIFTNNNISFVQLAFLNSSTGFIARGYTGTNDLIYKTTNGGNNWFTLPTPIGYVIDNMSVIGEDSIWLTGGDGFNDIIYRTTNSGASWQPLLTLANGPDRIYMFNGRIGFSCTPTNALLKTTNSGVNWFNVSGGGFDDIYFIDSSTGWKSKVIPWPNYDMKKTVDGGLNWSTQILPTGGIINSPAMTKFSVLNKDTIWGAGGYVFYGGGRYRGILYRTTNGGSTWYFQIPDTSFGIIQFYGIQLLNKRIGWGFGAKLFSTYANIHTTNGGDTTFLLGIKQISSEIPKEYRLYQNYPNPFNPVTNIKYQITAPLNPPEGGKSGKAFIQLKIYDITGKEIIILVNEEQTAGTYQVDFSGYSYSSGVYFYALLVNGLLFGFKKMVLLK